MLALLKRYRELIVVSALLLYPFATFMARGQGAREPNFVDRSVVWITAPLQRLFGWAIDSVDEGFTGYVYLRGVRDQNETLKKENAELRSRVQLLSEAELENQRLRGLLGYADKAIGQEVAARVIGVNPVQHPLTLRIDRGSDDGVHKGAAVITADGVVGQVTRVTGGYADVLWLKNPNTRTAVVVQKTRARATVAGAGGDRNLSLEYLLRTEKLDDGDLIITAGTDGVYPPGLVVGTATHIDREATGMFQGAEVVPAVDITKLEEVLVLPPVEWTAGLGGMVQGAFLGGDGGNTREAAP